MDVIATLKINNINGELLHMERQAVSDDMGYTLDEIISHYGKHIEEYLLNKVKLNENDCGEVILRYHYLVLDDEFESEYTGEQNEADDEDDDDTDELITEYDDGVTMYDLKLTNERFIVRFGTIRREYDTDGETSDN